MPRARDFPVLVQIFLQLRGNLIRSFFPHKFYWAKRALFHIPAVKPERI